MPFASLSDIKMYYHLIGNFKNKKNTLVFLHGGAGIADHTLYVPFWSTFADLVNIVFLDQRGCGKTERGDQNKWNLTQNGIDVFSFCEALSINKPIVAGVSWGGYATISYATQFTPPRSINPLQHRSRTIA